MSLSHEVTVWCDGEGCGIWESASGITAKEQRRKLKRRGWKNKGPKDFCPHCQIKEKDDER